MIRNLERRRELAHNHTYLFILGTLHTFFPLIPPKVLGAGGYY